MSAKGYVYILINPSMPGLLKIGKTTRLPEDRAKEISVATGVATPFIVAYKIEVNDCDAGERYIHSFLELQGYRVNPSREFFEVDMTVVINALIKYKNEYDPIEESEEDYDNIEDDDNPWESEECKGDDWYYGIDGHIIDYGEAIKHYRNAIILGSRTAFSPMGAIYIESKKLDEAFKFLTEGIDKGCVDCYRVLSDYYFELYSISCDKILFDDTLKLDHNFELFERSGYLDNAQRAFRNYVIKSRELFGNSSLNTHLFAFYAAMYIDNLHLNSSYGGKINYDVFPLLRPYKNEIYNSLYGILERRHAAIEEMGVASAQSTDEYFNEFYARFFSYM